MKLHLLNNFIFLTSNIGYVYTEIIIIIMPARDYQLRLFF